MVALESRCNTQAAFVSSQSDTIILLNVPMSEPVGNEQCAKCFISVIVCDMNDYSFFGLVN